MVIILDSKSLDKLLEGNSVVYVWDFLCCILYLGRLGKVFREEVVFKLRLKNK